MPHNQTICVGVMQRREAIQLFKDICKCMPDAFISSISLSSNTLSTGDFELCLNLALDGKNLENVEDLVSKRGLRFKECHGSVLIYGSCARTKFDSRAGLKAK